MLFWNNVIQLFWREELFLVLVAILCPTLLLLHFMKEDRKSVFNTLIFFLACLVLQFASGMIHALQFISAANMFHEAGFIGTGIAIIRMWGLLIFRIILPRMNIMPPRITEDIFVIIGYATWGMVRLRYAGLDLGSIIATSAMITAVVAFSMQDTLGNILGGLALQLDNSIEIGDWIKVDDISGRVVDIRWRSTLIETRNWETVVFPNSQLMKNKFVVLGRRSGQPVQWRRWIWFNVDLDIPVPRVIRIIEDSLQQSEIINMAKEPAPSCLLMEIGNTGYGRYALRYWLTDLSPDDATDSVVRWHILTALKRSGIKPAMEEHGILVTKENEKYEHAMHHREIMLRIKTLKRVELFSQMTEEELMELAECLRFSPFAQGDIISRQGATAHWLYIIIRGEAEVYLEMPDGGKHIIGNIGHGNFFGEMGLMTGEKRSASVVAKTDVECYRLDKENFEEILRKRPSIAEDISQVLATRRVQLDSALQDLGEEVRHKASHSQHSEELLVTIKRFFGL